MKAFQDQHTYKVRGVDGSCSNGETIKVHKTWLPTWLKYDRERIPYTMVDTHVPCYSILYRPYPVGDET